MSRKAIVVVAVAYLLLSGCQKASRPTWWKFQNNIMNWGQAQSDGTTGKVRFRRTYGGPASLGCPVLVSDAAHQAFNDSRIILGSGSGGLTRLVPLQGNSVGQYGIPGTVITSPAAPFQGEGIEAVYGSTVDGHVFSVSPDLGTQHWNIQLPAGEVLVTAPTVWNSLVFVAGGKFLFALSDTDGSIKWTYIMPGGAEVFYRSALPISLEADPCIYVAQTDGNIAKLKAAENKTVVWETKIPGIGISDHLMIDLNLFVYVPGNDGVLYVLDPADGHISWTFSTGTPGFVTGAALSTRNIVYFADRGGTLWAVDSQTHNEVWHYQLPAPPTTPPIVTPNEVIYIGVGRGFQDAAVVATNGRELVWPPVGDMRATVDFLAVGEDGSLYAVAGKELIAIK